MKKLALTALCMGFLAACGGGSDKPSDDDSQEVSDDTDVSDVTPPDATPDGGDTCDPLAQTGCNANERCTWIWDSLDNPGTEAAEAQVGHLACAADNGTVEDLGTCVRSGPAFPAEDPPVAGAGAGVADNCKKGSYCLGTVCKQICDHAGGAPTCKDNFSCNRYSGIFTSGGVTVAGVCDANCDPVTQRTIAGSVEACGSTNAADPNVGCFTQSGTSATGYGFSCARVPEESKTKLDQDIPYGPASGGAYSNGCQAGYIPFLLMAGSTTQGICNGTCAPADADNTNSTTMGNAVGSSTALAKLPNQATARPGDGLCIGSKKGKNGVGEDCFYLWNFNFDDDTGELIDSPFNDTVGICFDYSNRQVDIDGAGTGVAVPRRSCGTLVPETGTPPADYNLHAWEAGCYNSERTATIEAAQPPRSAGGKKRLAPDMHVVQMHNSEMAFRHVLL